MIKYTMKDVKALAIEIAVFCNDHKNLEVWIKVVDNIKKEFTETKEIILELLGPSFFAFSRETCEKIGLTDMIFETPVKMMPLYIESQNDWETIVARWRLTIDK